MLKKILDPFASLTLTVVLLALSLLLVYAGTGAQILHSIHQVENDYFHAWFSWADFHTLLLRPDAGPNAPRIPGGIPLPGGYTIGLLLLVNLIAAHVVRFKWGWKRVGVILILMMIFRPDGLLTRDSFRRVRLPRWQARHA